jgi:hypothetical protein
MERLTNLIPRSEQAKLRDLERKGLTMDWYNAKVIDQTLDGDVICAECSKPETKRLSNGKLRPLAIDAPRERLICQRCASKQRSEKARVLAAKLKEKREDESTPKSFEEFWDANRAQLDPAELARLQQRHEKVTFLYEVICDYNDGHDETSDQDRADTVVEVIQEIRDNGTVDADICTIEFFRKDESNFYNQILSRDVPGAQKHAKATAIFARYGFLTALPSFVHWNQIRIFLQRFGPKPRVSDLVTLTCRECHKATLQLPEEEAKARYGTLDNPLNYSIRYRCESCQYKADAAVRQFQERARETAVQARANETVFDAYGRVKDFDRQV